MLTEQLNKNKDGYVVLVTELFGEDLFQYINKRNENEDTRVRDEDKKIIMFEFFKVINKIT